MNILFFLKPKSEVVTLKEGCTIRQALELMEHHRFTTIPIISKTGEYLGTMSEGDLLWHIKYLGQFDLKDAEKIRIEEVKRHRDNLPIKIDQSMEDLLNISKQENFIPVIDDRNMFIGIITRQDIIDYFYKSFSLGVSNE